MSKQSKSKRKKKINIISIIIFILFLLTTIGIFGVVISLGILPMKYLIILLVIVGLIYFGIGKTILNKKIRSWVKIVLDIICIIGIVLLIFAFYYLNSTLHFMDRIKADKYQTENYYVLVEKDSKYEELSDIDTLGIYKSTTEEYKNALGKVEDEVKLEETEYDNYIALSESLFNKDVDAILISASYKEIVNELVEGFNDKVRILYTIEIKLENGVEASDKNTSKEPFNVYISGIDVYGDITMVSRSDVNMIATVNPKTNKILLTSIPRDYYVQLHGTTGSKDKLTHAGMYGVNMSINTIEDLLDIEIDYYVRVNFTTLISLVDAIGGIDVYSDAAFTAWTDRSCYYQVGMMHLDGKCALAFARERMAYLEGDRHRVQNQQDVIQAIAKKTLSSKTLITRYTDILESVGNSFQTNFPENDIYAVINRQLDKMPNWSFDTYSLNGFDSENATYTFGNQQLYVMEPDMSTVNMAKQKIANVMK